MLTIKSNLLNVTIAEKGAELNSVFNKDNGIEYMWNADPLFWAKKSPVLFPIVGTLKNDTYCYNGQIYHLPRHGFARDRPFSVKNQNASSVTFSLADDEETLQLFPFHFQFDITYRVREDELTVTYTIFNKQDDEMYFSVGGHPAFKVPLTDGTDYSDYELRFNKNEKAGLWPITKQGLIDNASIPFFDNSNVISLTKDLFKNDALVFKGLQSDAVTLRSDKTPHGLTFHFPNFPYLGIWAAPNADFVCIEPWCGIADNVNSNQQLQHKEGINHLPAGKSFEVAWQVHFF